MQSTVGESRGKGKSVVQSLVSQEGIKKTFFINFQKSRIIENILYCQLILHKKVMHKFYLFFFSTFLLVNVAFSQEVEYGVKAGLNISTLGKSDLGFDSRLAYNFGGTVEFITTPFFSVQIELVYSLQGAAIDRTQNIYLNYHYINIPFLAKAYFYDDASFLIGVQYGYLFKAVDKNEFYGSELDDLNKHDFAVVFGLEYKLNEKFSFSFRYNLGLTNTTDQEIIYEKRFTNRVLQMSFGYIF